MEGQEGSRWAAERVHNEMYAAEYDYAARLAAGDDVQINFTGEHFQLPEMLVLVLVPPPLHPSLPLPLSL